MTSIPNSNTYNQMAEILIRDTLDLQPELDSIKKIRTATNSYYRTIKQIMNEYHRKRIAIYMELYANRMYRPVNIGQDIDGQIFRSEFCRALYKQIGSNWPVISHVMNRNYDLVHTQLSYLTEQIDNLTLFLTGLELNIDLNNDFDRNRQKFIDLIMGNSDNLFFETLGLIPRNRLEFVELIDIIRSRQKHSQTGCLNRLVAQEKTTQVLLDAEKRKLRVPPEIVENITSFIGPELFQFSGRQTRRRSRRRRSR